MMIDDIPEELCDVVKEESETMVSGKGVFKSEDSSGSLDMKKK
jgi:hypothetical protein